ncbi:MAG: precorrin-6y C5,15-methyltransferase (decarboxylating) subunit CbiE [Sterolibacterium sp.]|nr:precorrin-6y C5,15-methyltransferase (decarboxylating) subunit CbiE [Sterolibacterium sp.]MBP9800334.1 precorrin-6y C5,15-methyltransferase (decarboxylating) subunit CbiE [Sterolibacterium sp.]
MQLALIGILDDGWAGLSEAARTALKKSDLILGVGRTLELIRPHLSSSETLIKSDPFGLSLSKPLLLQEMPFDRLRTNEINQCFPSNASCVELRDMDGALGKTPGWAREAIQAGRKVAVLATGDPLCHGLATYLLGKIGPVEVSILPAPSTLQIASARWQKPWQDAVIASCHGADAGEWFAGATPEHGLYPLMRAIAQNPCVLAFTSPQNTPSRLARALLTAGYGVETQLYVASRLLQEDERIDRALTLEEAAGMRFPEPNVVRLERQETAWEKMPRLALEDAEYQQRTPEKGLITKQEARALSLAKLRLGPAAVVWDIGAGSGSVGLEAARLAPQGHVWAIEKNAEDCANARANVRKFRVSNYTLHHGKAPSGLEDWPDPDAVFIGGSGGELAGLIEMILWRLRPQGRLVMNFVTLENLATATGTLKAQGAGWEVVQLQASRSQPILDMHRMAAQNPVWVVTAWRIDHDNHKRAQKTGEAA